MSAVILMRILIYTGLRETGSCMLRLRFKDAGK